MDKTNKKAIESYLLSIESLSLASGMMIFGAVCDSIKKEWPECEKVNDAYTKFDDSIEKACNNQLGFSTAVVNSGKAFLDELNTFQKQEDAQKENLQKLIKRVKENVLKIINHRD